MMSSVCIYNAESSKNKEKLIYLSVCVFGPSKICKAILQTRIKMEGMESSCLTLFLKELIF